MKKAFSFIVLVSCLLYYPFILHATLISFNPSTQNVVLGNSFAVDLNISGLGDYSPESLGAYDLDILFDPAIIAFQNVVFGTGLDIWGFSANPRDAVISSPGILDIYEVSFDTEDDLNNFQAGSFTLATLTFGTLTPGTSLLNILLNDLSDASGYLSLASDIENGSATVTSTAPIPEPATLLLFSAGLMGFGILTRKRR
jgi:hypothetical protein